MDPLRVDFERDGFVIVRRVFSIDEIDLIKAQINQTLWYHPKSEFEVGDMYFEEDGRLKNVSRLHKHTDFFNALMSNPRLVAIATRAFGMAALPYDTTYFPKYAHSNSATPPHQDNAFDCLDPADSLVLTICLDMSTIYNGCLVCIKGSHKDGLRPHEPSGVAGFSQKLVGNMNWVNAPEWYPIDLESGDICVHHANTVHLSGANTSSLDRRQFAIVYRTARAKRDEVRWAKYQEDLKALHESKGLT